MPDLAYNPVPYDPEAFLAKAMKRKGFKKAYDDLEAEYELVYEMLNARSRSGLTQDAVAKLMGTTKSAISRLEAGGKHAPSLTTLRKYAQALGCHVEIKFVADPRLTTQSKVSTKKHRPEKKPTFPTHASPFETK